MQNKYILGTEENKEYCIRQSKRLLTFGTQFPSPDGSSYYLGSDGTPQTKKPRETWITARMLHVYSIGAMDGAEECKALAIKALDGLLNALYDTVHGGWYAGILPDGSVLEGKQCYAHAFVILSACSAKLADLDGADELLQRALSVYSRFFYEENTFLPIDLWNTEFTAADKYRGLNATMHSVEAFLAAADALNDNKYRIMAGKMIDPYVIKWAKEFHSRLPEHFTEDWTPVPEMNQEKPDDPFKPYGATPGHGMEWARLIVQWAISTYGYKEDGSVSENAKAFVECAENLYLRAKKDGWNCDGAPGFVYTTDWNGKAVVHDRMHWTLAEAINTSAVLYRVTGKIKYANDYSGYLEYLDEKVYDDVHGSWYHQLDEKNRLKETVWPGKPDIYHAFQAMIIPHCRPEVSVCVDGPGILRKG